MCTLSSRRLACLCLLILTAVCLLLIACTQDPSHGAETDSATSLQTTPATEPPTLLPDESNEPESTAAPETETEPETEPETYEIYEAVIGSIRVQLYSDSVLRIEQAVDGAFCDAPTIAVTNRTDWPGVPVERLEKNGKILLVTPAYTVSLPADADSTRTVSVQSPSGETIWTMRNASGATVSLPAPGNTPVAWSFADDPRVIVPENGFTTVSDAPNNGFTYAAKTNDHYIFVCAGDAFTLRADYNRLVGACDMVTVKALGFWFSRFHAYRDTELIQLVKNYRRRGYPIDYVVVDTDWRVGSSTGYTVNKQYFPDMKQFLADMHAQHVSIAFNDHVREYNGSTLSPEQLTWFNHNLTDILELGLDTWWYDRNWHYTLQSPFTGIDKDMLGQLMYKAIQDAYNTPQNRRTVMLSNYYTDVHSRLTLPAYVGTHRYSVQWSGDITHTVLPKELENMVMLGALTSTAYVSSDIGGHLYSPPANMFIRWTQYGALSPIMRYHSSGDDRSPWVYGKTADEVALVYINLRYRLMPLYYTLAYENYSAGLPLCRRLDFYYPQHEESAANDQYLLGEDILVAPITGTASSDSPIPASWYRTPDGQSGVQVTYYNGTTLSGKPVATAIVPDINFHWGTGSPMTGVGAEQFSATFEATLTVSDYDVYLGTLSDDGVRVYVDGKRIIDFWQASDSSVQICKNLVLKAGRSYDLRVEYYEAAGDAIIRLLYSIVDPTIAEGFKDERTVFIPDGTWMDVFTGQTYEGPTTITVAHTIRTSPVFVRLGSLTPIAYQADYADTNDWERLVLDVYPAADTTDTSVLYEDDGATLDYRDGQYRKTEFTLVTKGERTTVTIGAAKGVYTTDWGEREWTLRVHAASVRSVTVNGTAMDFTVVAKDPAAAPFAAEGGSPDGDVVILTFKAPLDQASVIVIE